jgi:hypothetical protein
LGEFPCREWEEALVNLKDEIFDEVVLEYEDLAKFLWQSFAQKQYPLNVHQVFLFGYLFIIEAQMLV